MCRILCSSFTICVSNKRTVMPKPNLKGIVISVLVCSVFHFVHFRRFGDLKKIFLDIGVCAQTTNIMNNFGVLRFLI